MCKLIPALSLLKDGKMYGQLRRSFYENVCACFEAKEGAAGIQSNQSYRVNGISFFCFQCKCLMISEEN